MKKKFALVLVIVLALTILTSVLVACSSVTITFDVNGGKALETSTYKKTVEDEPIPERDGYDFQGWNTAKDGKGDKISFDKPYSPEKSITLYAQWTQTDPTEEIISKLLALMVDDINTPGSDVNNLVWDFELDAFSTTGGDVKTTTTYRLSSKANISKDAADATAIGFALEEVNSTNEVKTIFSIAVDNGSIYMEANGGEFQRHFTGFELGEVLKVKHFESQYDNIGLVETIFGALLGMFFQEGTEADNGDIVLKGTIDEFLEMLPTLAGALGGFIPGLESIDLAGIINSLGLEEALAGTKFTGTANIKDYKGVNITAVKDGSFDAGIELRKATFDAAETALVVPVKDEIKSLGAINIMNFTLEGKFSMVKELEHFGEQRVSYDYELRMDLDPFTMMNIQEDGSVKFEPMNIFNQGMLYLNVYHDCDEHGSYTNNFICSTRQSAHINNVEPRGARGNFLTVAFDPANFGNTNLNVTLDPNYILNDGFFNIVAPGMGGMIAALLPEYLGLSMAPEALMELIAPSASASAATMAADGEGTSINAIGIISTLIDVLSGLDYSKNYIELIGDVIGLVGGIKVNDQGLNIENFDSLLNILDNFVAIEGFDLSTVLSQLFAGTDEIEISVDNLEFADYDNIGFDAATRSMYVTENGGEMKKFANTAQDFTPVFSYDWITEKDIDGSDKVKITSDSVATQDGGKPLPLTAEEVELMLATGNVHYSGTKVNGATDVFNTEIISVIGGLERDENGKIKPGKHTVKLLTGMTDGGAIERLLTGDLIAELLGSISIPGNVVETTIIVTEGKVELIPPTENKFNPDTTYKYGDSLNLAYDAKIVYNWKDAEGKDQTLTKTVNNILPTVEGYALDSFVKNGKIANAVGSFTLKYNVCGVQFDHVVKMASEGYATKVNGNEKAVNYDGKVVDEENKIVPIEIYLDGSYNFAGDANNTIVVKGATAEANVTLADIAHDGVIVITPQENMVINGTSVSFTKSGTYVVKGTIKGATFEVSIKVGNLAPIAAAQFEITPVSYSKDNVLEVQITRPGNIFNGIGLDVIFQLSNSGNKIEAEAFVKQNGEDVAIDSLFLKAMINPLTPYTVYFKLPADITNSDLITIELIAKDSVIYGENASAGLSVYSPYRIEEKGFNAGDGGNIKPHLAFQLLSAVGSFDGTLRMEVNVNNEVYAPVDSGDYDAIPANSYVLIREGLMDFMGIMTLPMAMPMNQADYTLAFKTAAEYDAWLGFDENGFNFKVLPSGIAWKDMKDTDVVTITIYGTSAGSVEELPVATYSFNA